MSHDLSWSVLTNEDARGLQEYGLLDLNYEIGYLELHKGCFLRHDDISDALRESPPKPSDMLKIPITLYSRKALIWLGFSDEMANQLWRQWLELYNPKHFRAASVFRDTILTYFRLPDVAGGIPCLNTFSDDDNEWRRILHAHGLSQQFVDMIMDPRFRRLRLTESCKYWIEDTLRQRWDLLIKQRERKVDNHISLLVQTGRPDEDQEEDEDKDEVPDDTAKKLRCEGPVFETTFLAGFRGPPGAPPCACYVRKDSESRTKHDHLILYKVVTGTQLKDTRISSPGNIGPVGLSNIDSLVEVSREPEREPFLYNNNTKGDDDTRNRAASVGELRRKAHTRQVFRIALHTSGRTSTRGGLIFFTSDRVLALAEYKWAVHRLDKSVGAGGGAAKFAGGADVQMLEVRIPMFRIDQLLPHRILRIQYPSTAEKAYGLWKEIFVLSRLNYLLGSKSGCTSFPSWKWESDQETRRIAEPTLRGISEGEWDVLVCPAVNRRALWNIAFTMMAPAAEEGPATSTTSSSSSSVPSGAVNANHGTAPDPKYFIHTGDAFFVKPADEWVVNTSRGEGEDWFKLSTCWFGTYKVVLEEIT